MKIHLPLSPSRLNTYFKCPYKYYLKENKFPAHKTSWYHDIAGQFVHEAIELYFNGLDFVPTSQEIAEIFSSIYEDLWEIKPVPEEQKKVQLCLDNFVEMEQQRIQTDEPYKATFIEKRLAGGIFHGIIDWYHLSGVVRDWKTSKSYELTDDMVRQGTIYKYILERNGYKAETMKFEMLYSAKTVIMPFPSKDWMKKQLQQLKDAIKLDEFPRTPNYLCDYCEYQIPCEGKQNTTLWEGMKIDFIDEVEIIDRI